MSRRSATGRVGAASRSTAESRVEVEVDLDGTGTSRISTGVPFYDHMLTALSTHSMIDLTVAAQGDVEVDAHHTVEDVAIVIGQALRQALGDKAGISRYGDALCRWTRRSLTRSSTSPGGRTSCTPANRTAWPTC